MVRRHGQAAPVPGGHLRRARARGGRVPPLRRGSLGVGEPRRHQGRAPRQAGPHRGALLRHLAAVGRRLAAHLLGGISRRARVQPGGERRKARHAGMAGETRGASAGVAPRLRGALLAAARPFAFAGGRALWPRGDGRPILDAGRKPRCAPRREPGAPARPAPLPQAAGRVRDRSRRRDCRHPRSPSSCRGRPRPAARGAGWSCRAGEPAPPSASWRWAASSVQPRLRWSSWCRRCWLASRRRT